MKDTIPTPASFDELPSSIQEEVGLLDEATFRKTYSPELVAFFDANAKPEFSFHQNVMFALTSKTLDQYRSTTEHDNDVNTNVQDAGGWAIGAAISFAVFSVVYFIFSKLNGTLTDIVLWLTALFGLAMGYFFVSRLSDKMEVTFVKEDGKIKGLQMGRMESVLRTEYTAVISAMIGFVFACQMGLIYYTSNHLGLTVPTDLTSSFWITLDNLLHAITFDFVEIYNFHLGPVIKNHTFYSATSFLIFRLVFDALFLLFLFVLIRRHSMLQFAKTFVFDFEKHISPEGTKPPELRSEWLRWYSDEFLFLMLMRQYLRGNTAVVEHTAQQFHKLAIHNDVRKLFVEPQSHRPLFPRTTEESS